MKKFTLSLLAGLLCFGFSAQAMDVPAGETDVTTLEWVQKGQDCTKDFNNDNGSTVYGTDASGSNLSYVDVSNYGVIKLYGPANQRARLFINREECGDNGIFYVDLNEEGVGTFDCNTILTKQPKAQYIHLNGVKASAWNTHLNLSLITVSGEPIEFPVINFELGEGEIDLTTLEWVNEGQGCTNNLGLDTDAPVYGTESAPADGSLSYVDITDYKTLNLYGRAGDRVRLFINRAEYPENFQFVVELDENGIGTFNIASVYSTQEGAEYVHLNGIKKAWDTPEGKVKIELIGLIEKDFELAAGEVDLTSLKWENLAQGCDNRIGEDTDATVYGTHDGANGEGNLSYVDITNFKTLKLYGRAGDVVRLFINRAENPEEKNYQFYVTLNSEGVGTFNIAEEYAAKYVDNTYVHLNGIKTAATWQGSATGKAKIKGITLKTIDLNDKYNFTLDKAVSTDVTFSRNVTADKWNAICLPVAVHASELADLDVIKLASIGDGTATFEYIEDGEGLAANTPYLIKTTEDNITFNLGISTVEAAAAESAVDGAKLVGVYTAQRVPTGCYGLADGAFRKAGASNANALKPYRAYLQLVSGASSAPEMLKIAIKNDQSGIDSVEMTQPAEDGVFYNLNGQKVERPSKGLYIFNGKKVIIK